MLVRVPRQVLRYAVGEEERKALMRRTWETKLEKFGVVNIRVERCISIVDLWRAIFSAEAAVVRRAFVMVRPPGHHAEAASAGGFCIYNNVMVGVF